MSARSVAFEPTGKHPANSLPVWMYWEGECPRWIRQCQATVFAHAPDVRLLSAQDFDRLRDTNHDIDLRQLHAAQRADYIRAFLLARNGGLWVDSDCIVMRSLQPLLDLLRQYDFVAHRERTAGVWANDLMGAAPGSKIASELYRHIRAKLCSDSPLRWTTLGCMSVTQVLRAADVPWFEIKTERIQPICWSTPGPFFRVNRLLEHERDFDGRAICYMLSNLTMQAMFEKPDVSNELLKEGTFFSYLICKSLHHRGLMLTNDKGPTSKSKSRRKPPPIPPESPGDLGSSQPMADVFTRMLTSISRAGHESVSGPGSSLANTAEIRKQLPLLTHDLRVRSLLDAACGDFNWMRHVNLGIKYIGADVIPSLVQQNQENFSGPNKKFMVLDITRHPVPKVDLIFCRDCLVHLSNEDVFRALRNFQESKSKYLLTTTFERREVNSDIATGDWRPANLRIAPFNFPEPIRIIDEKCTENDGIYADKTLALWKLKDLL